MKKWIFLTLISVIGMSLPILIILNDPSIDGGYLGILLIIPLIFLFFFSIAALHVFIGLFDSFKVLRNIDHTVGSMIKSIGDALIYFFFNTIPGLIIMIVFYSYELYSELIKTEPDLSKIIGFAVFDLGFISLFIKLSAQKD